jgi:hypothetical protein
MVSGGFSTFPSISSFFSDGYINDEGGWTAGIYSAFGPATTVTAYGYCHSPRFPRARKGESDKFRSVKAPKILQEAEKAAISERVLNKGCYPAPRKLAKGIRSRTGIKTGTARSHGGVREPGKVFILTRGHSCGVNRMSARVGSRVFTINSATGAVRVKHLRG